MASSFTSKYRDLLNDPSTDDDSSAEEQDARLAALYEELARFSLRVWKSKVTMRVLSSEDLQKKGISNYRAAAKLVAASTLLRRDMTAKEMEGSKITAVIQPAISSGYISGDDAAAVGQASLTLLLGVVWLEGGDSKSTRPAQTKKKRKQAEAEEKTAINGVESEDEIRVVASRKKQKNTKSSNGTSLKEVHEVQDTCEARPAKKRKNPESSDETAVEEGYGGQEARKIQQARKRKNVDTTKETITEPSQEAFKAQPAKKRKLGDGPSDVVVDQNKDEAMRDVAEED
jgi:hypothetical protein